MKTWRQMEKLVDMGLVRNIGTSNMTIPKLELLLRDAEIKPACNEMELHPHFQQPGLFEYVQNNGIVPVIVSVAENHGIHPAVVCLKWAVQRGQVPIPMSTNRRNILANIKALVEDPLSHQEMQDIAGIDRNCRLIKGQVFLWKDNQDWQDLWDLNGTVTLP